MSRFVVIFIVVFVVTVAIATALYLMPRSLTTRDANNQQAAVKTIPHEPGTI
ncbi:unnamed protein product, partial [marine sediment metagenome]